MYVAIFSFFYSFVVLCRSQNISWYMMILDKFLNVVLVGETIDKIGRLTTNLLLVSSMLCYQLKYRQQQKETAKHCAVLYYTKLVFKSGKFQGHSD